MAHNVTMLRNLLLQATQRVKIGGSYTHYKTPSKYYRVTDIALLESNEKPVVVYTDGMITWVRDLEVWCEKVDHNGEFVNRFTLHE